MQEEENAPDHRGPLEAEAPAMDANVLGESHGLEHLWSEHATVADLDPTLELWVEGKDLERRLGVRVIRRLEAQLLDAHLVEEGLHEAYAKFGI